MSFWNRNKHIHDFGPWSVTDIYDVERKLELWEITLGVKSTVIGRGIYQKRACKDKNCNYTQIDKQRIGI
jgi:hypothetical protein